MILLVSSGMGRILGDTILGGRSCLWIKSYPRMCIGNKKQVGVLINVCEYIKEVQVQGSLFVDWDKNAWWQCLQTLIIKWSERTFLSSSPFILEPFILNAFSL